LALIVLCLTHFDGRVSEHPIQLGYTTLLSFPEQGQQLAVLTIYMIFESRVNFDLGHVSMSIDVL
jgi:hypothetical protein